MRLPFLMFTSSMLILTLAAPMTVAIADDAAAKPKVSSIKLRAQKMETAQKLKTTEEEHAEAAKRITDKKAKANEMFKQHIKEKKDAAAAKEQTDAEFKGKLEKLEEELHQAEVLRPKKEEAFADLEKGSAKSPEELAALEKLEAKIAKLQADIVETKRQHEAALKGHDDKIDALGKKHIADGQAAIKDIRDEEIKHKARAEAIEGHKKKLAELDEQADSSMKANQAEQQERFKAAEKKSADAKKADYLAEKAEKEKATAEKTKVIEEKLAVKEKKKAEVQKQLDKVIKELNSQLTKTQRDKLTKEKAELNAERNKVIKEIAEIEGNRYAAAAA